MFDVYYQTQSLKKTFDSSSFNYSLRRLTFMKQKYLKS